MSDKTYTMEDITSLTSSNDVAAFLTREGFKGTRDSSGECPIAMFFRRVFPDAAIQVSGCTCCGIRVIAADGTLVQYDVTSAMGIFISKFDRGSYPALDINHTTGE